MVPPMSLMSPMPPAPQPFAPPLLPLQQSPVYHAALTRIGAQASLHALSGEAVLIVTRCLPVIGQVALLSRPFDLSVPDLRHLRRSLMARALIVHAETPDDGDALGGAGWLRLAAPRGLAHLSLDGGAEDWLARMDGKWRNRLRHGMRQRLATCHRPFPHDPQHWLFHKDAAQQAVRGYRGLPPRLIAAMAAEAPGAVRLFTARQAGRIIAAMLFVRHGTGATYLIGWSDAAGRAASAHTLLMWQAMAALRDDGVRGIDLGLCDPRGAPGLARFKLGSGARLHPLGGTWAEIGALAPVHAGLRALASVSGARPGRAPMPPGAARCRDRVEGS